MPAFIQRGDYPLDHKIVRYLQLHDQSAINLDKILMLGNKQRDFSSTSGSFESKVTFCIEFNIDNSYFPVWYYDNEEDRDADWNRIMNYGMVEVVGDLQYPPQIIRIGMDPRLDPYGNRID